MEENVKIDIWILIFFEEFHRQNDVKVENEAESADKVDVFVVNGVASTWFKLWENEIDQLSSLVAMPTTTDNQRGQSEKEHIHDLVRVSLISHLLELHFLPIWYLVHGKSGTVAIELATT